MSAVKNMTVKERWLASARMKPVDRLPFWPKLGGNYPDHQEVPFSDMSVLELHEWIGSDQHNHIGGCIKEVRQNSSFEHTNENGFLRSVYKTQHGTLELHQQWDEASNSPHPIKFPVETLEDIKIMTEWYRDAQLELDEEALEKSRQQYNEYGDSCVAATGIGESPLMHWVEWTAGVENAHYLLADYTEEVEELFDAMHQNLCRRAEILADNSPADFYYMVENTSTTLISPSQYRKYCLKHLADYAERTNANDKIMVLHMCGLLKDLLPDIDKLPVQAFEAFTSPTLGNTTYLDGRTHCREKMLIGGTNAVLWTKSTSEIIAEINRDLAVLPHHRGIAVTSAGVMPPLCKPATIKAVCDWVKEYPSRM